MDYNDYHIFLTILQGKVIRTVLSNGSVNSETIFGVKRQSFHCLWGIVKPQKGKE